jgi:putative endonuclease
MLANRYNGAIYVGVTSNLLGRVMQHRAGVFKGHTEERGIYRLVYSEVADAMEVAIRREKSPKRSRRAWKRELIERDDPAWLDLAVRLGLKPLPARRKMGLDPGSRPG